MFLFTSAYYLRISILRCQGNRQQGSILLLCLSLDQENSDPQEVAADSNSMVVIVAVLVGVLAVVALGLIVALVIVTKRHRYQSAEKLIVTDM